MTEQATPLTAAEEADLRRQPIVNRNGSTGRLVDRLLATLDAERAARAEPGLREALERIEGWSRFPKGLTRPTVRNTVQMIHDEATRALAALREGSGEHDGHALNPDHIEADAVLGGSGEGERPETAYCPCAGQCHHSPNPCSFGCMARPDSLDAAWREAEEAAKTAHPNYDLGLRRLPDGGGYAWSSGFLGEPPAYTEVHYPGESGDTPAAALRGLAARLAARQQAPEVERP